jgi:hypothetical protein
MTYRNFADRTTITTEKTAKWFADATEADVVALLNGDIIWSEDLPLSQLVFSDQYKNEDAAAFSNRLKTELQLLSYAHADGTR